MEKIIQKRIKELEARISNDRVIQTKKGNWVCKFCKEHPEDCFCNDDAKLELKGIKFVLKNQNKKNKK